MQSTITDDDSIKSSPAVLEAMREAAGAHDFDAVLVTSARRAEHGLPILYVNQAFTAMTGYEADEVVGQSPAILQGPKTDRTVLRQLSEDMANGRPFHGRAVNYRKDGSEFMLEWKVAPVRDEHGSITHFVSVQREVN